MPALLADLRERRAQTRAAADEIISRAAEGGDDGEPRDLTAEEFRAYTDAVGELREIDDRIERLRDDEVRELRATTARTAGSGEDRSGEMLIRAITSASGIGAAATPPEYASTFWDRLVPESVLLASGVQVISTTRDSLILPRLTADPTAAWTAEAGTITASDPNADTVTATPRKLAALVRASNESLADASPSIGEAINRTLARSLALSFDLGGFTGSGTAPTIRGLANVAGIGTVSSGANGATPTTLDIFADGIGTVVEANANASVIVMAPRTWRTLSKIKEVSGSSVPVLLGNGAAGQTVPRSLYGVPVLLSAQLPINETQGTSSDCSSVFVYDASQVVVVRRQDLAIEVDRSVYFTSDETAVRAVLRVDLVVPNPAAVVRITGIRP